MTQKRSQRREIHPPMNAQWLAAIRERVIATDLGTLHRALSAAVKDRSALFTEVMRLRSREEAALAIVRRVAAPGEYLQAVDDVVNVITCRACGHEIDDHFIPGDPEFDAILEERIPFPHADGCLTLEARALLANINMADAGEPESHGIVARPFLWEILPALGNIYPSNTVTLTVRESNTEKEDENER